MYVWVVNDNKVNRREVSVMSPTGDARIHHQRIESGEKIITAGVNQLVEGEKIRVVINE